MRVSRAALLLAPLLAVGCGGIGDIVGGSEREPTETPARLLKLERLSFTMRTGANGNSPARVALVRVQDVRLVSALIRIEAKAWFGSAGEAFRGAHPEAFYDDWELVPGLRTGPFEVALDEGEKVAGVLFCDTLAGPPPLRVERDGEVTVEIDDDGCTLSGGTPSSEPSLWNLFNWL